MHAKWMMAPWMRRRIARHVERGTSERVIACLVGPVSIPGSIETPTPNILSSPGPQVDLSNVILFRALASRDVRPPTPCF